MAKIGRILAYRKYSEEKKKFYTSLKFVPRDADLNDQSDDPNSPNFAPKIDGFVNGLGTPEQVEQGIATIPMYATNKDGKSYVTSEGKRFRVSCLVEVTGRIVKRDEYLNLAVDEVKRVSSLDSLWDDAEDVPPAQNKAKPENSAKRTQRISSAF